MTSLEAEARNQSVLTFIETAFNSRAFIFGGIIFLCPRRPTSPGHTLPPVNLVELWVRPRLILRFASLLALPSRLFIQGTAFDAWDRITDYEHQLGYPGFEETRSSHLCSILELKGRLLIPDIARLRGNARIAHIQ